MKKDYKELSDYLTKALDEMQYALKRYLENTGDSIYFLYAAQKKAEEVIETAITLNQDILYERFEHMSKSYYDTFIDLEKLGIFDKDFLKKIANTAGFRNRLAHEYMELDPQITVSSMRNLVELYPIYANTIEKYLSE